MYRNSLAAYHIDTSMNGKQLLKTYQELLGSEEFNGMIEITMPKDNLLCWNIRFDLSKYELH